MDSEQSAASVAAKAKRAFGEIEVNVTFEGYETMSFVFRRRLNEEEKAEKQHFLALNKEEQNKAQYDYRVTTLASILLQEPVGLPDYDKVTSTDDIKHRFKLYFENRDYEDILNWTFTLYSNKLYPKEPFSKPSES